ncbi:hypothetical protein HBA54_25635 [Pelagibius litoralis]|uniref:Uncharacterized protein n=1 Tax=Pelagibius litoralis TaxID=374515 RepID=A0A967F2V0_9PROT|nr:2OG-Fe(II) oxygenase family protein [Pelagibius litoralis]NIA71987.1 hypothetical protein [Pelagibius litoralis]
MPQTDGPKSQADGFLDLWPTTLLLRSLPGHEAANAELLRLIAAMEVQKTDLTTDYRSGNLLTVDNPAITWLRDCINKTVIDYLKRAGLDYAVNWSLQGWANVNRRGDYHDPHNHPHAYLSGTYYLQVPEAGAPAENRADVRPGAISFYDPRGAANMTAIRGDRQIEAEFTHHPKAGEILLWPAFLLHFVHPNLAEEKRVSISFNAVLKWSEDYLPDQG